MALKYPQRTSTHIAESDSFGLLQSLAPSSWVLREATERDYGIDCYIELAKDDGSITGDLALIQLKSSIKGITWKSKGESDRASSHSIKCSTANYWLGLQVPVFLLEADLNEREIYFVSVEPGIRKQYECLSEQESLSFELSKSDKLSSIAGIQRFMKYFHSQRKHEYLAYHLSNLIMQVTTLPDFVISRQMYDSFLELEGPDMMQARQIHETCRRASEYLGVNWGIEPWEQLILKDQKEWSHSYILIHEATLDYMLKKIELILPELLKRSVNLIAESEGAYWRHRDYTLYYQCVNTEISDHIRYFEQRSKQ